MIIEFENNEHDKENEKQTYILNTNSGVLHTKECADRPVNKGGVNPGHKKHYKNLDSARKDPKYKKDHELCLG